VIGVDWGKQTDFTVFSAIDCSNKNQARLVGFQRFRRTSYIQAVKNLHLFQSNFETITECYHDKTGVGLAIEDIIYDEHVRAEGITFTNENKTNMVISLMNFIEKAQMLFPHYKILFNELQNYEMSFTRTGKMSFNAAPGSTDDIISSILLSLLAYTDNGGSFELITIPEPQPNIYRHPQSGEYIYLDDD
jgi:phage FluMu gp28-like protein